MSIPEFDITGQKVLIVGGGRGIGKGIALAFAEAGADVAVSALTPIGVNKVAEEVRALGRNALALTGDATRTADMDRVARQVLEGFGHLDTLVTCVGDSIRKPVVQVVALAQVSGRTELRSFIARAGDRREHELGPGHVGQDSDRDLERPVAARRIRDANAVQGRRPSRVTIGTRGSGSRFAHAGRIHASNGSSAAAIDRRSPASPLR